MTGQWEFRQLFKKFSLKGVRNYWFRQWISLRFQSYPKVDDLRLQLEILFPFHLNLSLLLIYKNYSQSSEKKFLFSSNTFMTNPVYTVYILYKFNKFLIYNFFLIHLYLILSFSLKFCKLNWFHENLNTKSLCYVRKRKNVHHVKWYSLLGQRPRAIT